MYLNGKPTETLEQLLARQAQLTRELLEGFELNASPITLESIDDLYSQFDRDQLFLVQDGVLCLSKNGQNLVNFDEGDLIGLFQAFNLPGWYCVPMNLSS